jgi:hypothetical protein
MFSEGNIYLRQIAGMKRWGLLVRGVAMYEVMTGPGVTRFVTPKYLGGAVGHDPRGSRRDMQEAQATTRCRFDEGRRGEWVHYSTAGIVAGESLRTD